MLNCGCENGAWKIRSYGYYPKTAQYFQEITLLECFEIPEEKPDMERITGVNIMPEVVSVRLVKTREAVSYSGQNLTGYKLVAELTFEKRIKYVAELPCQSVHAAHGPRCMRSAFIVVPQVIACVDTEDLVLDDEYNISAHVLFADAQMIDERTVQLSAVILVNAVFCEEVSACSDVNTSQSR